MGAQFTAHLTGTAISENYRNSGSLFQAAYDDLSKHAVAYRQLCLFLRKPAGREAYPSDVFYLHARLLERSCNLGSVGSFGALMCLPVIETLNNDLSAYIATNVISITDGQIYLDLSLFGIGQCPAVSTEKSVSRVGAKSLDSLSRGSAFQLYSLIGDVKQESDNANKTEGFVIRFSRFKKFLRILVQRSSQSKNISTALNFGCHVGNFDSISVSSIGILLLAISDLSLSLSGNHIFLSDRLWQRENQQTLELSGMSSTFLTTFASSLRTISAVVFTLTSALSGLATVQNALVASILITANSTTSFLVDLSKVSLSGSESSISCSNIWFPWFLICKY